MNRIAFATAAALALIASAAAWAQGGAPASAGVYTDAQATRGQAAFTDSHCVTCHGPELGGGEQAPPLAGNIFLANWVGSSLGDLATRIKTTMPADNPGSLSDAQVADLVAYILQQNKYKSGAKEFPADSAAQAAITLDQLP